MDVHALEVFRQKQVTKMGQTKSPTVINFTLELKFARIHFWREAQRRFCVHQAASWANSISNIRIRNFDYWMANAANIYTRPTIAQKDDVEMATQKPFSEPQMFAFIYFVIESFYSFVFIDYTHIPVDDLSIWTWTKCILLLIMTYEWWSMTHGERLASSISCFVFVLHHSEATSSRNDVIFFSISRNVDFSTHQGRKYTVSFDVAHPEATQMQTSATQFARSLYLDR